MIHVDIMDGHFVPPLTFGPNVVEAIAEQVHAAGGIIDVHLMIEHPERQVPEFARAGADSITIHVEATPHVHYALQAVREGGCTAGAAITPATPAAMLADVAADGVLDLALCMSVNPGWGNQKLIQHSFRKLEELRAMLPSRSVSRSTAVSTPIRPEALRTRAPTCWWPAPPCSAQPIRRRVPAAHGRRLGGRLTP